jgi:hypothetical protein
LIREECILKNKNKLCPYKKLSVFYNTCLKTFGSHLVFPGILHPTVAMFKIKSVHMHGTGSVVHICSSSTVCVR